MDYFDKAKSECDAALKAYGEASKNKDSKKGLSEKAIATLKAKAEEAVKVLGVATKVAKAGVSDADLESII